jgi:uncharacterized protein YbbC (DUF1343 family)
MKSFKFITLLLALLFTNNKIILAQNYCNERVQVGAARMEQYLPLLQDKRIGIVMNQSSLVGKTLLLDTLLQRGVAIKKIFAPEHGVRGTADAGEHLNNGIDSKTGLPIISLYGNHRMPSKDDLKDIDIIIFDLQDVLHLFRNT